MSANTNTAAKGSQLSAEAEVTLADQKLINRFARLNAKSEELTGDLAQKTRQLENTCEALDELVIQSDHVMVSAGEVLAQMSPEEANEWCEELKTTLENDQKRIRESLEVMKNEMSTIKATLYARFGSNINLEYEDE